jgi:hypothetical protein
MARMMSHRKSREELIMGYHRTCDPGRLTRLFIFRADAHRPMAFSCALPE